MLEQMVVVCPSRSLWSAGSCPARLSSPYGPRYGRITTVCVFIATCDLLHLFSPVLDVGLFVPYNPILGSHPPKSMLDTSFRKLLIEEHQQLFEEFFVREPSTKELELKKTAPGENVGETEAHHYRTPVQYCSSKERRGWIACVVPWWPWGRWSIKPPSKKTHRKLQSVMRVVPVPILPKPQQHSSHRSPLVLVVSRPILPEPQQRRHWMTCTSRTIPITENLAKVFRKVLKINYVWIDI